ncbi:LacI family DNA-binding transcriptional regulator [Tabrizicola sp. J26]|uniref:LacI family DNA-binding transcriptional regulator n=1 Tax=Alitabrizicola rongguiensis TaxID=2909234 RepID=UPI001F2F8510|nr:LacI family DNA-binding transcriptional regulator [Tabrizicola rongguiensis]MCF1708915.1 LacI family DNA-binding transcriptional regulator [Tabrizicola rongguiensis]
MAITLKEVAERAGVSRAAVSRAFTEGASVSAKTRAKVEKAAAELGYSPNMLARSLTTRRTQLVGLVSNNFRNPVFLQIFDQFTRAIQERGLRPLLLNLTEDTDPARSVQLLRQYSVDGVIVASSHLPTDFARAFRDAGLPVVHAFGRAEAEPKVNVVAIDNVAAGRMAAETLIARGYRQLGFLGGPEGASTTQDRLAGFSEHAARQGVPVTIGFAGAYSFEAGHSAMQRLLAQETRPDAWFCADDVLSIGALSAAAEAGLRIPDEIGIIGLNDMEIASWSNIALTTIHQPFEAIVAASIDLIVSTFNDPARAPEVRLFPCHIVERRTLRPLP